MKGLALKFWAGMTALIAGMLVLLWVFQVVSLQRVYVDEIMSQINEDAEYLADCLSRNESDEFMSSASTLAYTKNISVQAYVTESLCIFNTESATPSPSSLASSSAFKHAVSEALSGAGEAARAAAPSARKRTHSIRLRIRRTG